MKGAHDENKWKATVFFRVLSDSFLIHFRACPLLFAAGCNKQSSSSESSVSKVFKVDDSEATVLRPVDPHKLSPTELQYGIAPKRTKDVIYQDNVIIMEEGDKAIRSIASDGMTWTFDANAPHVSEFKEGSIVFATSRAVGRILKLQQNGNQINAVLGPVQITDVIKKGFFTMDQSINMDSMIVYAALHFPSMVDTSPQQNSSLELPEDGYDTVTVSTVTRDGKWKPTSRIRTYADGRAFPIDETGDRWSPQKKASRPVLHSLPRHNCNRGLIIPSAV